MYIAFALDKQKNGLNAEAEANELGDEEPQDLSVQLSHFEDESADPVEKSQEPELQQDISTKEYEHKRDQILEKHKQNIDALKNQFQLQLKQKLDQEQEEVCLFFFAFAFKKKKKKMRMKWLEEIKEKLQEEARLQRSEKKRGDMEIVSPSKTNLKEPLLPKDEEKSSRFSCVMCGFGCW
ncbi:hypothetical protein RFI_15731 [Reticulomyxa filosa]|uniref:Uncharacterized protein n=1 Tax=Reticulomyxa filosa TaxID=46433 RepID=X6N6D0_RETFI|nr:hypothetical protein RFI_15731 [Reticulomyxa filosa]|eukprot:ETO21473.1 hypothetical protein RFI_15731 [Reticulomyxa filosa]